MSKKSEYLSHFYIYHYLKLAFRAALFCVALTLYIINRSNGSSLPFGEAGSNPIFWSFWWICLAVGMFLRLFPSKFETIGCQKQMKCNYIPTGEKTPRLTSWRSTLSLTLAWIGLNLVFGILYFTGVFDAGILLLITFAYAVCDIICILFLLARPSSISMSVKPPSWVQTIRLVLPAISSSTAR